jgi:hypothetical protein
MVPEAVVLTDVSLAPTIVTLVAVSSPALVTWNGAEDAVGDPAKNGYDPGATPTAVAPEPAVMEVALIAKPPMFPAEAEMVPVMLAFVATTEPSVLTKNGLAELGVALPAQIAYPALADR